jgi:CP family cyanate transporter-like MFS transporter
VHYAHDGQASSSLTAMVFLISYGIAATVPVLMGLARDATGSFSVPFAVMTVIAVSQLVLATRLSGRYRGTVE